MLLTWALRVLGLTMIAFSSDFARANDIDQSDGPEPVGRMTGDCGVALAALTAVGQAPEPVGRMTGDCGLAVTFSLDGNRLLTKGVETAQVWDAQTFKAIGQPLRHTKRVYSACFGWDGAKVFTAGDEGFIRVSGAATAKELTAPWRHGKEIEMASFSLDGARIVTVGYDHLAKVWDTSTGRVLITLQHERRVFFAAFSANGSRLLTTSELGWAHLWDVATAKELISPIQCDEDGAAISPDGKRLAVVLPLRGGVGIYDAANGAQICKAPWAFGQLGSITFSPDGTMVLVAAQDCCRVLDAATGKPRTANLINDTARANAAVFSRDGKRVAVAADWWQSGVWDVATGHRVWSAGKHIAVAHAIALSPDGNRVAVGGWQWDDSEPTDPETRVWTLPAR